MSPEDKVEKLEEALQRIDDWANKAYAEDLFGPMTGKDWEWVRIQLALGGNKVTVDRVSAALMRHAMLGIGKIAKEALGE